MTSIPNIKRPASRNTLLAGSFLAFLMLSAEPNQNLFAQSVRPNATEVVNIWPDLAPDETSRSLGVLLPLKENENPPIDRVESVRLPTMEIFAADKPDGTAILILPGGGFARVVPNLEGSEAAPFLNELGISVFVLNYRTNETKPAGEPNWQRPLQDGQRALRWIHANAGKYQLNVERIGVLGFSAGGQVAAVLQSGAETAAYESTDSIDGHPFRPDFTLLIYPWQVLDPKSGQLLPEIQFDPQSPPAFIVHTHDDASTSLGSVAIYAGLKKQNVPAELHVYENGGHGYGLRARPDSNIGTWPERARDWLIRRGLGKPPSPH